MIPRFLFPIVRGDYIAMCEGDDFWTNPNKLQSQVDFLDKHLDYALCFHPVSVFFENGDEEDSIYPETKPELTIEALLGKNYIQTNSVVYRTQNYKNIVYNVAPSD
jgi:hypothetical protein